MIALKKHSPTILGLFWMISLGFCFVLGVLFTFTLYVKPSPTEADSVMRLEDRELQLTLEKLTGYSVDLQAIKSVAKEDSFPDSLEDALIQVVLLKDPVERQYFLKVLAEGLPLRKIMAAIKYLQERPSSPGGNEALDVFFSRWATLDGRSALAFVLGLKNEPRVRYFVQAVLQGWSSVNALDAWNWVEDQRISDRLRGDYYREIIDGLANEQGSLVLKLLQGLADEQLALDLTISYLDQRLSVIPLRDWLPELEEIRDDIKYTAIIYIGEIWAQVEPEVALSWMKAEGINGTDLQGALEIYAWQNPQASINWAIENINPEILKGGLERIALAWMDVAGPAPLAEWLNQQNKSFIFDGAIRQLALTTAQFDYLAGLQWAQSITNEDERSVVEIMIGEAWINEDEREAYAEMFRLLKEGSSRDYFFGEIENASISEPID